MQFQISNYLKPKQKTYKLNKMENKKTEETKTPEQKPEEKKQAAPVNNQNTQQSQVAFNTEFFAPVAERFVAASGLTKTHFEKEVSFAIQLIHSNKRLAQCTQQSILKAVMNVANVGLTLNPVSRYAYLVPRWNSGSSSLEATLMPSYMGLVKLLTDAGTVKTITATLIYDNDQFEVIYGMYPNIIHKPVFENRGKIKGVYAVATLTNGEKQFEVMTRSEIEEIRERSESYIAFKGGKVSSCTWTTDEGEMYRKTVVRRLYKYLPKSEKSEFIDRAIEMDEQEYKASPQTVMYIDELLRKSTLSEERQKIYELELSPGLSAKRASEIISMLQQNQAPTLNQQFKEKLTLDA